MCNQDHPLENAFWLPFQNKNCISKQTLLRILQPIILSFGRLKLSFQKNLNQRINMLSSDLQINFIVKQIHLEVLIALRIKLSIPCSNLLKKWSPMPKAKRVSSISINWEKNHVTHPNYIKIPLLHSLKICIQPINLIRMIPPRCTILCIISFNTMIRNKNSLNNHVKVVLLLLIIKYRDCHQDLNWWKWTIFLMRICKVHYSKAKKTSKQQVKGNQVRVKEGL